MIPALCRRLSSKNITEEIFRMDGSILRKYAKLAVCSGVNVQKDQPLVINASVRDADFVEYCVEEAYKAGASQVSVHWSDEVITHMDYEYQDTESLKIIPDWFTDRVRYEHGKKACYLHILSDTPGFMSDIDQEKLTAARLAYVEKMMPYQAYTMNNIAQWCIVSLPNPKWAKKLFPDLPEEKAMEALWDAILTSVRVRKDNDPVAEWVEHNRELASHSSLMNDYRFDKLHFESETGTDLYVGLVKDHIWCGGACETPDGVWFNPNMPTEEVFCMPDRSRVDGKVVASKPLSYNGKVVEDFWLEFKDGAVTDYGAEKAKEALDQLIETDEGSRHLGEVALISYDSPISNMNILFFNTLFDENASCHLALGRCYPENIKGGSEMTEEELLAAGGNHSLNHVDFMFGTREMKITGIKADGSTVEIFRNGNFVI